MDRRCADCFDRGALRHSVLSRPSSPCFSSLDAVSRRYAHIRSRDVVSVPAAGLSVADNRIVGLQQPPITNCARNNAERVHHRADYRRRLPHIRCPPYRRTVKYFERLSVTRCQLIGACILLSYAS